MSKQNNPERRKTLKILAAVGLGGFAGAASSSNIGVMMPGKGWVKATGARCEGDGTPLQFIPKAAPDDKPLQDELKKYPKCPYCGMSRTKWHHSRHLVHYDDGLVDGTCSIHCLAISLSLNIDRGAKSIYAADFGSSAKIKSMVEVDKATYLVGGKLKGTMTSTSKMAFASKEAANAARSENGGDIASFDGALREAYINMYEDTMRTRKRRGERRERMMKKMNKG